MNIKKISVYFLWLFVLILVISVIVTFLYSLIVHGTGIVDGETSIRLALIFSIVLTWMKFGKNKI